LELSFDEKGGGNRSFGPERNGIGVLEEIDEKLRVVNKSKGSANPGVNGGKVAGKSEMARWVGNTASDEAR